MHTFDSYTMGVVSHLQHLATGAAEHPVASQVPTSQAALQTENTAVTVQGQAGAAKPSPGPPNGAHATPNGHDEEGPMPAAPLQHFSVSCFFSRDESGSILLDLGLYQNYIL